MLSAFRFYEMTIAMHNHFKDGSAYNYYKYGGRLRIKEDTFLALKPRYLYEKLARRMGSEKNALIFLASNHMTGRSFVTDYSHDTYLKFVGYGDSIQYKYEQSCKKYIRNLDKCIKDCQTGDEDAIYFFILLNEAYKGQIFKQYKTDDILWDNTEETLNKITPFLLDAWCINNDTLQQLRKVTNYIMTT